ncbi:pentraxin-related protein PTX3 [Brachyhypopomus gauderio]|uniref:pentraxin-related protein PTX3 n=1 Tax=Brachyhypopomus gauderio TaxID=698409 RepID=UPI0040414C3E
MSTWMVIQTLCLLGLLMGPQAYEDNIQVKYTDHYNAINEREQMETEMDTEATPPPCTVPEYSKWDKLFTMLENSQMKENMLLQQSDDVVRVELQALRGEVLRLGAQHNSACSASAEGHAHRAELRLRDALADALAEQRGLWDSVLAAMREQAEHLGNLDTCCSDSQRATKTRASGLQGAASEGQDLSQQAELYMGAAFSRLLPAGCESALFFPMRSSRTYAEVTALASMQTDALTVCMWVKPTQTEDKVVLFSYGTSGNPLELQLLLRGQNALFTVGGEAHLVEVPSAVQEGKWTHLCATWDSEHGMAALAVGGHEQTRSFGVAEGHHLLEGGTLILGQDYSCQDRASRFTFRGTSNTGLPFTGKITGVNVWDRVLEKEEIYQQAQPTGSACGARGNLVAWGVSPIETYGAVELVF